ncbi:Vgb family protein [Halopseudomonas salegens]|uniref:Sugar lactone lactonase YvrE n=1 Tax=Halopseudomonas salegens TaxID=1434072 RepID=A0A1H2EPR4_9GAMM|nr:SMP-30/gluconolactonase/LRE family protein [Halopseudomonas salegens]SDT97116.1 Sugar lactone lactonase YvrE [Halopseudomonas salegens]
MPCLRPALLLTAALATSIHAASWTAPDALVAPSAFKGVHGLAIDQQGRLLAGSVVGNSIYQVDRDSGDVSILIGPDKGQADDIAIGPKGEMAWTGFQSGRIFYRAHDDAEIIQLADGLPGINSIAFNLDTGALYASQVFMGDALWQIDRDGAEPPRLIREDMGGFNGFEVGADGWIYGPLWFKGQVARINPEDGDMQIIAEGLQIPAAVNFDSKGNLFVVDTRAGELLRISADDRELTRVATLATALDNLAVAADDRIYVSNMADNSITRVNPLSGETRVLTRGDLAVPAGLAVDQNNRQLYVADIFAFRRVDLASGKVTDIRRAHGDDIEYPTGVSLGAERILLTSFADGSLQILRRSDYSTEAKIHDLPAPTAAVELPDGRIALSLMATGEIFLLDADLQQRTSLASDLHGPVSMQLGQDGALYLTEAAGLFSRVDVDSGKVERLATDLAMPEGLVQLSADQWLVAETAKQQVSLIDLATGERQVIAADLPIGFPAGPGMPPSGIPTGLALDASGNLYFGSDLDNGLYRMARE